MQKEFTLQNIEIIAAELCSNLNHYKVWAFDAEMGAGKTTFIHALCNVLKVTDTVGSPTFSIINQYQTQAGNTIYHLDLYRIKDEEEAIQAGVEDVLYSGNLCLVEWPVLKMCCIAVICVWLSGRVKSIVYYLQMLFSSNWIYSIQIQGE